MSVCGSTSRNFASPFLCNGLAIDWKAQIDKCPFCYFLTDPRQRVVFGRLLASFEVLRCLVKQLLPGLKLTTGFEVVAVAFGAKLTTYVSFAS